MINGSPQTENGYTRIANELLDAIVRFGFSKRQITVLLAIARKTYGYNKKTDDMTVQQLANMTAIPRQHVSTTISELVALNAVLKRDGAHGYILGINKNYGAWGAQESQNRTVPKQDVLKQDADRPETGHIASQNRTHKRQPQKTTPKEYAQTGFARFWEAYPKKRSKAQAEKAWKKLKPSEELTATILSAISAAKESPDWVKEGGQYIPYPATWLNAQGWLDELPAAKPTHKPPEHFMFGVYAEEQENG